MNKNKRHRQDSGQSDASWIRIRKFSEQSDAAHDTPARKDSTQTNTSHRSLRSFIVPFSRGLLSSVFRRGSRSTEPSSATRRPSGALTPNSSSPDLIRTRPFQLEAKRDFDTTKHTAIEFGEFHVASVKNLQSSFLELSRLRRQSLECRKRLQSQYEQLKFSLNSTEQSQIQLDGQYKLAGVSERTPDLDVQLEAASERNRDNIRKFLACLIRTRELERECQNLDSIILCNEPEFESRFSNVLDLFSRPTHLEEDAGPKGEAPRALSASDEAITSLKQFRSRRGDLIMHREELAELEEQYEESLSKREVQQDQDALPSTWHEDFIRTFKPTRDAILSKLRDAEAEVEQLRAACLAQGVSLKDLQPRSSSSSATSDLPIMSGLPPPMPAGSAQSPQDTYRGPVITGPMLSLQQASQDSSHISLRDQTRMHEWIDTLPVQPLQAQPFAEAGLQRVNVPGAPSFPHSHSRPDRAKSF